MSFNVPLRSITEQTVLDVDGQVADRISSASTARRSAVGVCNGSTSRTLLIRAQSQAASAPSTVDYTNFTHALQPEQNALLEFDTTIVLYAQFDDGDPATGKVATYDAS